MIENTESWARYGACRDAAARESFFETDEFVDGPMTRDVRNSENTERRVRAKLICSSCHVKAQCLQDAFDGGDTLSIRGGLTPRERAEVAEGKRDAAGYGYSITNPPTPRRSRGNELARRFAAGERLSDLCEDFGIVRQTALQTIRERTVAGDWVQADADISAA